MGQSADVRSHESIEHFRIALLEFQEVCTITLMNLDTEKHQANQWLEYDMPTHWKKQVRVTYEQIAEARASLRSCQMRGAIGDKKPSCIEEKKELEKAIRNQEFAKEMVHVVRRWALKVHKESDEFTGRIGRCKTVIDNDVSHAAFLLKNMVQALEKYLSISAPTGEPVQIQNLASMLTKPATEAEKTEDEQTEGENAEQIENAETVQEIEKQNEKGEE